MLRQRADAGSATREFNVVWLPRWPRRRSIVACGPRRIIDVMSTTYTPDMFGAAGDRELDLERRRRQRRQDDEHQRLVIGVRRGARQSQGLSPARRSSITARIHSAAGWDVRESKEAGSQYILLDNVQRLFYTVV